MSPTQRFLELFNQLALLSIIILVTKRWGLSLSCQVDYERR